MDCSESDSDTDSITEEETANYICDYINFCGNKIHQNYQTYTRYQKLELEKDFHKNKFPNREQRIQMAHKLCLTREQIKRWFKVRRYHFKIEKQAIEEIDEENKQIIEQRKKVLSMIKALYQGRCAKCFNHDKPVCIKDNKCRCIFRECKCEECKLTDEMIKMLEAKLQLEEN